MEEDRQEKQMFLREQILDGGLDPTAFSQYIGEQQQNGTDIDNWTMKELRQLVVNFRKENNLPGLTESSDQSDRSEFSIQKEKHQEEEGQNDEEYQQYSYDDEQWEGGVDRTESQISRLENEYDINYFKLLPCIKVQTTSLNSIPNIKVTIPSYQKQNGGIFSSSFILYNIRTDPFKWEVTRRYSEFLWLREVLQKLYPSHIIPPMPKKGSMRNFQPLYINKRMIYLEMFLNKILKSPELRNCKFVEGFLGLQDDTQFKIFVKEGNKCNKITQIEAFNSVSGKVNLSINNPINVYCNKATDYITNADYVYQKMRKLSKQLLLDYDKVSETLYNIGDCFSQLYTSTLHFNNGLVQGKNPLLEDLYITMNNMNVQWGNAMSSQIKLIQENLTNFFKFYHHETQIIKETIQTRDEFQNQYINYTYKLNNRKESFLKRGDFSQVQLPPDLKNKLKSEDLLKNPTLAMTYMFPKETQEQQTLREIFAYYNNQAYEEIKRSLNDKVQEYSEHFLGFGKLQTHNITQMHILWADTIMNLTSLGNGQQVQLMESFKKEESVVEPSQELIQ